MRLNPSTSGGAAESTSSMYACNPPEGPSMCQQPTIAANRLRLRRSPYYLPPFGYLFHGAVRLFHESGYLFHEAVTYSRRLRA